MFQVGILGIKLCCAPPGGSRGESIPFIQLLRAGGHCVRLWLFHSIQSVPLFSLWTKFPLWVSLMIHVGNIQA